MSKNKILKTVFDTSLFNEKEKLESYKESIGAVFEVDTQDIESKDIKAKITSYLIDEIMLIDCLTLNQFFFRKNTQIAKDSLDHIIIQYFISGSTLNLKRKDAIHCENERLIIIDTARPWEAYNTNFQNLSLVIPRRLLYNKKLDLDIQHGRVLECNKNPFAHLLMNHILSLYSNIESFSQEDAYQLVSPSIDIVVAALSYTQNNSMEYFVRQNNMATTFKIKEFIELNLTNSNLCIELILVKFNLTKSTLYRLFPNEYGGIKKYIQMRRLSLAFRLLKNKKNKLSISEIAYRTGFESQSSFSRAFKNHFYQSPKMVQESQQIYEIPKGLEDHFLWKNWIKTL